MQCTNEKTSARPFARFVLISGALLMAASPALAQKTGSGPSTPAASASSAEGSSPVDQGTGSLNRTQADNARAQNAANAASANTYNSATADYQAARTAATEAQARYEQEMQAHRDAQAAYAAAYARWQADVAACRAGEHSRCQSVMPGSGPS